MYKHVRIAPHRCNWTIIRKRTRKQKNDKTHTSTKENVPPKCKKEKRDLALTFPLYPFLPFPQNQQPQKSDMSHINAIWEKMYNKETEIESTD